VVAVALLVAAACSPTGGHSSATRGYGQADLQGDVDAIRAAGAVGVQARVTTEDGEVLVATSGVADIATGQPVPAGGHYRIASNTKPFTATVVLQLAGEGRLSLDDPVERHLPGVIDSGGHDGGAITIRDLLRHTSGFDDSLYQDDGNGVEPWLTPETYRERRFRHYNLDELVAIALRYPPKSEPGTRHDYTNVNYLIAGMIIEQVTGNSWADEVTGRIIKPLGLRDTTVPSGPRMPDPHAKSYYQFIPGGPFVDVTLMDVSLGGPGGAIISTPKDFTRFFRALLGGPAERPLLAPELLAEMRDTVAAGDGRYGLGLAWSWLPCGGGYWRHGGAVPAYLSSEGFTGRGERGVVVSVSSMAADPAADLAQQEATTDLIETALCAR
jgi:D-alanyl-D-alanine carboxypeptidase